MPNLADKYEALLSDLDTLEEIVKSPAFPSLPTPTEVAAMGRVILEVRPLLDTIVEIGAELEVALVQNAQIEPLEKERDELREEVAQLKRLRAVAWNERDLEDDFRNKDRS